MGKIWKTILLGLLLAILWTPLLQRVSGIFNEARLKGAYIVPERPEFSVDSFLGGSFQKKYEAYENYSFGFRPFLIKLKNSLDFILYRDIDNTDLMAGKNDVLYSRGSADRTMWGKYYNGREINNNTLAKIKFLKEKVESGGGHLIALMVPSKESVMPEYLPSSYDHAKHENSDYEDFIAGYEREGISYIDLCSYFRKLYPQSKYPLFTKTGFHWSTYGASVAQDTILKYCQSLLTLPIPYYERKGVEFSDTARFADADFEDLMNLYFSIQQSKYVYPKLEIVKSSLSNHRPKVIIIGDSFFWQIKDLRKLVNIFSDDSKYWYYFRKSFPLSDEAGSDMKFLDVVQELESADFVILESSMGTLGEFPFGVTEYFQEHFENDKQMRSINGKREQFNLKAANGKFVCADISKNNIVIADREKAAGWETFSILLLPDNKCAIYTYENKYFSAELGGQGEITASRYKIAGWETFTMIKLDSNHVALRAANGKYLAMDEKSLRLFARADAIGKNEKFEFMQKGSK